MHFTDGARNDGKTTTSRCAKLVETYLRDLGENVKKINKREKSIRVDALMRYVMSSMFT